MELKEKLKELGLDLAEDSVKDTVENCFGTLEKIIKVTENKYDDLLLPLLDMAKPFVLKEIDKIDGKVG